MKKLIGLAAAGALLSTSAPDVYTSTEAQGDRQAVLDELTLQYPGEDNYFYFGQGLGAQLQCDFVMDEGLLAKILDASAPQQAQAIWEGVQTTWQMSQDDVVRFCGAASRLLELGPVQVEQFRV